MYVSVSVSISTCLNTPTHVSGGVHMYLHSVCGTYVHMYIVCINCGQTWI